MECCKYLNCYNRQIDMFNIEFSQQQLMRYDLDKFDYRVCLLLIWYVGSTEIDLPLGSVSKYSSEMHLID